MTTALEYGPPAAEGEVSAYAEIAHHALFAPDARQTPDDLARVLTDGADVRVVRAAGQVVAGLAVVRASQWFGGNLVPSSAVVAVAVAPLHRGRGVGAFLMRSLVTELRAGGDALSALYPATLTLYRAAGYELAGVHLEHAIPSRAFDGAKGDADVELRPMTDADQPMLDEVHRARVRHDNGPFERTAYLWKGALAARQRSERYVLLRSGCCVGYVATTHRKEPRGQGYDVVVNDMVALDAGAAARIGSLLAGHRSMAPRVIVGGAAIDPLLFALPEHEGLTVEKRTDWMLRVVDVRAALEARGYPEHARAELHLEIQDSHVRENDGRWVLSVSGGRAEVRSGGTGALRMHLRALAPLYTGYLSAHDLARAGALAANDDASLAAAASLFAGPTPWTPDKF